MNGSFQFRQRAMTNSHSDSAPQSPSRDQQSHYTGPSFTSSKDDDSDEWEYEYSTTETEVRSCYPIAMSVC